MAAIINMGVYTLPEPFNFDGISEKTAKKLGHNLYGNADILLTCAKPVGIQEVSITLWEESGSLSCTALDVRYTEKGFAPNPWHLIAFATMQPDFADKRPIATQWKDAEGNFCCAIFRQWIVGRRLYVNRNDDEWRGNVLFSGSGT